MRFEQVPHMQVHILDRPDAPSVGAGQASPGPTSAAIGTAHFGATGLRMRRLPFAADAIRRQALMT
ncbi:hypothetical protein Dshi_2530 [Dinoroseobacter shibae DFL 12 = DSM 16493]|uniref:Uncharacterized protein n=1 Tax=Dinoroseobacter shibae (strain DSM 16493 / NCIMB 14021 / DFL 12) TaxID=398580 RepID=A8LSR4_DINSH|nr:hypothetical protein Dshi_2530 [Dinoroseobacter shibae DFL 12 = DSM 16493]